MHAKHLRLGALSAVATLAVAALPATAAAATAYEGNVDDFMQISQLMARYAYTLDNWDGDGWAATFTEDGTFHFGPGCIAGRPALAGLIKRMAPANTALPPQQHVNPPGPITYVDKDHAWVHSPAMVIGSSGFIRPLVAGSGLAFTGAYDDTLRRVNGRWLIADRTENLKTADYKPPAACTPPKP